MKTINLDRFKIIANANAPYWAAENYLIENYFKLHRTKEKDQKWVLHQIYKEFVDGVLVSNQLLQESLNLPLTPDNRVFMDKQTHILDEELGHGALFIELFESITGELFSLRLEDLKKMASWDANDQLMNLRKKHFNESPDLGLDAQRVSEGGYCALFKVGSSLPDTDENKKIRAVCQEIYDEEFNHMLFGISKISFDIDDARFDHLVELTKEQMKARIYMRYMQFSCPVNEPELASLLAGEFEFEDFIDLSEVERNFNQSFLTA